MIGNSKRSVWLKIAILAIFFGQQEGSFAFSTSSQTKKRSFQWKESQRSHHNNNLNNNHIVDDTKESTNEIAKKLLNGIMVGTTCVTLASCTMFGFPSISMADEYGQEREAPTVYTGETLQICTKRGPLGACLETTSRTVTNDNDKSDAYFRDPSEKLKEKYSAQLAAEESKDSTSDLIKKLKQQTEDNKDKNALIVKQKTLQNNLGASFGPLDGQVVIMNVDGQSYTLLKNPQAMRLKEAGYIKDRKFITQPTPEVIEKALVAEGGIGEIFNNIFGAKEE